MVRLTGFEPTTCSALRAQRLLQIEHASHLEVVGSQTLISKSRHPVRGARILVRLTGFEPTTCSALRAQRLRRIERAPHLEVVSSQTLISKSRHPVRGARIMVRVFITDSTPYKPNRRTPVSPPVWKGRRNLRIWSFPGSYRNQGSGME